MDLKWYKIEKNLKLNQNRLENDQKIDQNESKKDLK